MDGSTRKLKLSGIVPPLVTPLAGINEMDREGLVRLLEHVIAGGVHGVFILGTTGELSRLSYSMKREVIKCTCEVVNGRVPVLVGVTDTSMHESLRLEKIAAEYRADAVVIAPPFYYHVEQDELLDYFREVASRTSLPIYLYNMPSRTNIVIEIDTVVKSTQIQGIIGIKDSSGDMGYLQNLLLALSEHKDFSVFVGPEEIMAQSVLMGAAGGVNGGANLFPQFYVKLFNAAFDRDLQNMKKLQEVVGQIITTLYRVGKATPNFIKIIKEALRQKEICSEIMEKPYIPFSDQEKIRIRQALEEIEKLEGIKN